MKQTISDYYFLFFHFFIFLNKLFCDVVAEVCQGWRKGGRRRRRRRKRIVSLVDNLTIQQILVDNPTSVGVWWVCATFMHGVNFGHWQCWGVTVCAGTRVGACVCVRVCVCVCARERERKRDQMYVMCVCVHAHTCLNARTRAELSSLWPLLQGVVPRRCEVEIFAFLAVLQKCEQDWDIAPTTSAL